MSTIAAPDDIMICGFSSIGCPALSLPEMAALVKEYRLDFLELRAIEGTIDLPAYFAKAKAVAPAGTKVQVVATNLHVISADEEEFETFLRYVDVAKELEAPYVRIFGGGKWGDELTEAHLDHAVRIIGRCRAALRARAPDCEMLLETHSAFSSSAHCLRLNARLDEPVRILWDAHHTWRSAGESPRESWEHLGPLVRHMHFSDSRAKISEPGHQPYDCILPGTGEFPVAELVKLLGEVKYGYGVSLEWERLWHPELPEIHQALDQFVRLLGRVV